MSFGLMLFDLTSGLASIRIDSTSDANPNLKTGLTSSKAHDTQLITTKGQDDFMYGQDVDRLLRSSTDGTDADRAELALSSADYIAIRALHAGYWMRADGRDNAAPEDLFVSDATLILGSLMLHGVEQIAAFFRKRQTDQDASGRVTRHFAGDVMLGPVVDGRVATYSTVMAVSGYGSLPIASSLPSIADFDDICVRQSDGRWLFERRLATSIFTGPEAPAFARAADQKPDQGEQ